MEQTMELWVAGAILVVFVLNISLGKYLRYKERKSIRNLNRLLDQAKRRLGENNVYGRRK